MTAPEDDIKNFPIDLEAFLQSAAGVLASRDLRTEVHIIAAYMLARPRRFLS